MLPAVETAPSEAERLGDVSGEAPEVRAEPEARCELTALSETLRLPGAGVYSNSAGGLLLARSAAAVGSMPTPPLLAR